MSVEDQSAFLSANKQALRGGATVCVAYVAEQGGGLVFEGKLRPNDGCYSSRWQSRSRGVSVDIDVSFTVSSLSPTVASGQVSRTRVTVPHADVCSLTLARAQDKSI